MQNYIFSNEEIKKIESNSDLRKFLIDKEINIDIVDERIQYEKDLQLLQIELLKLQNWILKNDKRVVIIFEGRDASGKGGSIKRFQAMSRKNHLVKFSRWTGSKN